MAKKAFFRSNRRGLSVYNFIDSRRTNSYAVPAPIAFDAVNKHFYRKVFLLVLSEAKTDNKRV
jgi:hypothetical protein